MIISFSVFFFRSISECGALYAESNLIFIKINELEIIKGSETYNTQAKQKCFCAALFCKHKVGYTLCTHYPCWFQSSVWGFCFVFYFWSCQTDLSLAHPTLGRRWLTSECRSFCLEECSDPLCNFSWGRMIWSRGDAALISFTYLR